MCKLIAIGGPTQAGKSSCADALVKMMRETKALQAKTVCIDDYFQEHHKLAPIRLRKHSKPVKNYETPGSIHGDKFRNAIIRAMQDEDNHVVIVEGFLVFAGDFLNGIPVNLKLYLHAEKELVKNRRCSTLCATKQSKEYFDKVTWPSHLQHGLLSSSSDAIRINVLSSIDKSALCKLVCSIVNARLFNAVAEQDESSDEDIIVADLAVPKHARDPVNCV